MRISRNDIVNMLNETVAKRAAVEKQRLEAELREAEKAKDAEMKPLIDEIRLMAEDANKKLKPTLEVSSFNVLTKGCVDLHWSHPGQYQVPAESLATLRAIEAKHCGIIGQIRQQYNLACQACNRTTYHSDDIGMLMMRDPRVKLKLEELTDLMQEVRLEEVI